MQITVEFGTFNMHIFRDESGVYDISLVNPYGVVLDHLTSDDYSSHFSIDTPSGIFYLYSQYADGVNRLTIATPTHLIRLD